MKATLNQSNSQDTLGLYLKEVRRIELLTPEEEVVLARRAQSGDKDALNELVRRNLRFVVSVAKQYSKRGVPLEDLINEGNLGLVRAARRFDVDRGFRFISYAVWWVRQGILQFLAEHSRTVRLPLNKSARLTKVSKAVQVLNQKLGREPTSDEIAEYLELKPEDIETINAMPTTRFSIDEPAEGQDNDFQIDTLTDQSIGPEEEALEHSRSDDIDKALATLNDREADILRRYYGLAGNEPHTLEEIGKVYHLTRERVRQIQNQALAKLKEMMGDDFD
jgi:RNA polymerase primary sigma factor